VTAALLTIFLLSLIGVPLTGGFFGKFYIFKAALESKLLWLASSACSTRPWRPTTTCACWS
jgi:NADH-quinone oxidoreductase subunit N